MEIAIIGLPQSGKTTVFNALTRGKAEATGALGSQGELHVGVAKVPDPRLDVLARMFNPKKVTPAEVKYWDIPAADMTESKGISGRFLNILQRADALLLVVRAFEDPSVAHVEGSVDPDRDAAAVIDELAFADLQILERLVQRRQASLKSAKGPERDATNREVALLTRVKEALEDGTPVRELELTPDERRTLANYQFLTAKPLLIVYNLGEERLPEEAKETERLSERYGKPGVGAVALCGKLEAELAQLPPEEEEEFRKSMEAGELGLSRVLRASYALLGLVSFLTAGEDEVRAWPVQRGSAAQKAAGKIHSDIERGFIRAEVVAYDDLMAAGSLTEARKKGTLRLEGKTYEVKDGDVINFLFNV